MLYNENLYRENTKEFCNPSRMAKFPDLTSL